MEPVISENTPKTCEVEVPSSEPVKKKRIPKRILHFSDGTLEEYSSDEDTPDATEPAIDLKSLSWGPWFFQVAKNTGKTVLGAVDYVGEGIANTLGISSSKYFYEIEEYKRAVEEEEKQKQREATEMTGWSSLADPATQEKSPTPTGPISTDSPSSRLNSANEKDRY